MRRPSFWVGNNSGAVAPTVALSLFALIGAGGIAFDYARLATLDTELQNAADQAALAAVTQLDQQSGAIARATAAAQSLLANQTLMANDNNASGLVAAVSAVVFYATKADAEAANGLNCPTTNAIDPTASNANATAKFVCVRMADRVARYALTPVTAAFSSGNISAMAVAGLGTAICKVPPVMICNPDEPTGNSDKNLDFDIASRIGAGLRLISVGNGNTAWAPGNFGYLDTGSPTSNPNVELRQALGWVTPPGDCSGLAGVKTRTGAGTPVTQALNTRFDIYEKANTGNGNAASCPSGATCPASINTVKDVIQKGTPNQANKCGVANNEWELPPSGQYYGSGNVPAPSNTTDLTQTEADTIKAMGYPRDKCHAISQNGSCTADKVGNGAWDRGAYFRVNYGWTAAQWPGYLATGTNSIPITNTTPSRYQVYRWEVANRGTTIGGKVILGPRVYGSGPNGETAFGTPVCSQLQGYGSGMVPGGNNVDRRRISTAVINCNAWNVHGGGGTVYGVVKWIELFLVEPSLQRDRTDVNDVYAEFIGQTQMGAGSSAGQVVRHDVPYLVK
ncbi:pilus assembly protein TadG-related protein [Sphingomonas sp. NSE70-1]|uniref:Pilus assembly protein TadG-related protein n=1 Tax=Sphingomonas caseinilyticus TaxID=2908205 RepID=A0ABT0RVI6_9SPHN|nr:pilus assembly protein TadG-related protein [Sphingomonas caseinilyticus]MCL6698909.1 pilus assembly protein TadG-related protein [Sphingomonas caseinilyticus]